jgi:small-conductance mechanosensitive channel
MWQVHWAKALMVAVGTLLAAWILETVIMGALGRLARRTKTTLDDTILDLLGKPVYLSLLLVGFGWSFRILDMSASAHGTARAGLITIAVFVWGAATHRVATVVLKSVAQRAADGGILQARTLPLFEIVSKTTILSGGVYFTMVAWHIDVGAWLASAGVVGVAVGFAAKDSLANYFAGVMIIADSPYRVGDTIRLEDGVRGIVSDIGLRSTRLHTPDGIELNIPNSVLGSSKIENLTAGPSRAERITVSVGVAYGSDVEEVIEVLRSCASDVAGLVVGRPALVRFVAFGDSSLDFKLQVWANDPSLYEQLSHELHMAVYRAFNEASISIPFPQRDLHVKQLPRAAA